MVSWAKKQQQDKLMKKLKLVENNWLTARKSISADRPLSSKYIYTFIYDGYKWACDFPPKVFEQEIKPFPSGWNNSYFCQSKQGRFKFYMCPTACSPLANNLHAGNISNEREFTAPQPGSEYIYHACKQVNHYVSHWDKEYNDKWGFSQNKELPIASVDNLPEKPVFWQIAPD